MATRRKPWDKRENESDASYARFLAYRNLGPRRSVKRASKSESYNGQWFRDSQNYSWSERANAWDVEVMKEQGRAAALMHVRVVAKAVEMNLRTLLKKELKGPATWPELMNSLDVLSKYITPETIQSIVADVEDEDTDSEADQPISLPE